MSSIGLIHGILLLLKLVIEITESFVHVFELLFNVTAVALELDKLTLKLIHNQPFLTNIDFEVLTSLVLVNAIQPQSLKVSVKSVKSLLLVDKISVKGVKSFFLVGKLLLQLGGYLLSFLEFFLETPLYFSVVAQ